LGRSCEEEGSSERSLERSGLYAQIIFANKHNKPIATGHSETLVQRVKQAGTACFLSYNNSAGETVFSETTCFLPEARSDAWTGDDSGRSVHEWQEAEIARDLEQIINRLAGSHSILMFVPLQAFSPAVQAGMQHRKDGYVDFLKEREMIALKEGGNGCAGESSIPANKGKRGRNMMNRMVFAKGVKDMEEEEGLLWTLILENGDESTSSTCLSAKKKLPLPHALAHQACGAPAAIRVKGRIHSSVFTPVRVASVPGSLANVPPWEAEAFRRNYPDANPLCKACTLQSLGEDGISGVMLPLSTFGYSACDIPFFFKDCSISVMRVDTRAVVQHSWDTGMPSIFNSKEAVFNNLCGKGVLQMCSLSSMNIPFCRVSHRLRHQRKKSVEKMQKSSQSGSEFWNWYVNNMGHKSAEIHTVHGEVQFSQLDGNMVQACFTVSPRTKS
jgi:hypothetical protein